MSLERLRKAERIRSSPEFREVLEKGEAYGGKHLVLFCLKGGQRGPIVGFTTTRRVPNAVVRNRAKRLMREAYRRVKYGVEGRGLRLVFLARGDAGSMTFEETRAEMIKLLASANLWRG